VAGIAVVGAADVDVPVTNFADVIVFELTVSEPGSYVVFARVVLSNENLTSDQNATVRFRNSSSDIDWVDVRIPMNTSYAISLQGTLVVSSGRPDVIGIHCSTSHGFASRPWTIAIQVDSLKYS
jgi:hypothetical protein